MALGFETVFLGMAFYYLLLAYLMHLRSQNWWFLFFTGVSMFMVMLSSSVISYLSGYTIPYNETGSNFGAIALEANGFVVLFFILMVVITFLFSFWKAKQEEI